MVVDYCCTSASTKHHSRCVSRRQSASPAQSPLGTWPTGRAEKLQDLRVLDVLGEFSIIDTGRVAVAHSTQHTAHRTHNATTQHQQAAPARWVVGVQCGENECRAAAMTTAGGSKRKPNRLRERRILRLPSWDLPILAVPSQDMHAVSTSGACRERRVCVCACGVCVSV